MVQETCLWSVYFLGSCKGHVLTMLRLNVWPILNSIPDGALIFLKTESIWSKKHVFGVSMFWDPVNAKNGPCYDYVWPILTSIPPRYLIFSRLSQYGPRNMSLECLHFGTIHELCFDHFETLF